MLDGSSFREAIERSVDLERLNEAHVDNRVDQHRNEAVRHRQNEQELEPGDVAGAEPQRHFLDPSQNLKTRNEANKGGFANMVKKMLWVLFCEREREVGESGEMRKKFLNHLPLRDVCDRCDSFCLLAP